MSFARTIFLIASLLYTAVTVGHDTVKSSVMSRCVDSMTSFARNSLQDGRTTLTFTDRQEHIVLKRSIADGGNYHDTYYIYDDFGLLQAVLPPALSAQAGNGTLDSDLVDQYAYLYQYNARNELTGRKLPGAGWENFGYDTDTNRLIWSQNAVQRANQEYTVYLYDALGRECVRGIMDLWPSGLLHPVKYTGSASGLGGYEVTGGANVALKKVLAVNYYDNYQFVEASSIPRSLLPAQASCHVTQGLLTGTLQARLSADADAGDTPMCADVLYYDYRGNIIRDISSNPLGGYDVEDIGYNFTRQVISRTVTHHADIPGKKITETYAYTYDHAGRAVKTTHSVGGNPGVTLVENSYDALGRLASTARGGSSLLGTAYAYNIRDWMTGLDNSLFSEELHYTDNPYNTGNRSYSGNIIAVGWRTDQTQRAYDFTYDNLSRLTGARYHEEGADGRYTTQYSYDSMGNMLTLKRNGLQDGGTYGQVDNLSYSYDGNQLTKISDSVEDPSCVGAFNFRDGADDEVEYTYDANGNMTSDKNRGITAIAYNVIGQPERITFADGKTTEYVYSYDGTKLQVTHKSQLPPTETTTTYCDNLVYENGVLKQILVGGGYVTLNGSTPVYHFYIRDHLGNNRVVAKADGTVEQTNHYYPYGGLMADISTGSDLQPYKYNGKELDRMHGLDTYDYGARQYAAAIGRWDRVDPLCEKYYDVSPYAYCGGNPINAIDPDGRSIWTKMAKAAIKIGTKVSRNGLKELGKAATYADAVSGIIDDFNTVSDSKASTLERVGAGVSLASEILPVSVRDVKDAGKIVQKALHGNSKASTNAQHAYDIIDKRTGERVKTGVSGGKIRKDGKSYRAEQQVRKWNKQEGGDIYKSEITHKEPAGEGAREKILEYERERAKKLKDAGELDPRKHIKP